MYLTFLFLICQDTSRNLAKVKRKAAMKHTYPLWIRQLGMVGISVLYMGRVYIKKHTFFFSKWKKEKKEVRKERIIGGFHCIHFSSSWFSDYSGAAQIRGFIGGWLTCILLWLRSKLSHNSFFHRLCSFSSSIPAGKWSVIPIHWSSTCCLQ